MDEINKAALERTDEFVKLGHKTIQDSIEFARERSYIHECVKGDNDSVESFGPHRTNRRFVKLNREMRDLVAQLPGWSNKVTKLILKLQGAAAAFILSSALNKVMYSGKDKDEIRRRYSEDEKLFLYFVMSGNDPVSVVVGRTITPINRPIYSASDEVSEIVSTVDRESLARMARYYLDSYGEEHRNFVIRASWVPSPWKVWGDIVKIERGINNLLAEGDAMMKETARIGGEMQFIHDIYERGAIIVNAREVVSGNPVAVNLAEVEKGTLLRCDHWSAIRTTNGWIMDDGVFLTEDEMASNAGVTDGLIVSPVSVDGIANAQA
mgnify:FL=1